VGATLWKGHLLDVKRQLPVVLSIVISFLGVVMILRPTIEQNQVIAGLVGLASGMIAAMAYIQVAELGREGEPVERTVFYFSLAAAASGALVMLFTGVSECLDRSLAVIAHWHLGRIGPMVHDPRLQRWGHHGGR